MREVISIHVGQAGVQIGNACCKLDWSIINLLGRVIHIRREQTRVSFVFAPYGMPYSIAQLLMIVPKRRGALHR